jgi:hypothetical protein
MERLGQESSGRIQILETTRAFGAIQIVEEKREKAEGEKR